MITIDARDALLKLIFGIRIDLSFSKTLFWDKAGTEADDLIASAAIKLHDEGHEVYIVSADKDFGQLLRPGIFQLLPPTPGNAKLGWSVLDEDGLYKKLSVKPNQVVDYLALLGDTSDNIPGVPGVGPKIAARWIQDYGTLEHLLTKVNYIQPARFQLVLPNIREALLTNVKMIKLNTELDVGGIYESSADIDAFMSILESLEMKTVLRDAKKRLGLPQES